MRKWIAAVAAATITLTAAGSFWLLAGAKAAPTTSVQIKDDSAYDVAERFLRHLGKGQFRQAYEMTTPELRAKLSLTDFIKEVGIFERVEMQSVAWTQTRHAHRFIEVDPVKGFRWNVTEIEFNGALKSRGGDARLNFAWINETGTWQMQFFRWKS